MKMKAVDTFHTSGTKTVQAGQEFDVTGPIGRELERRGLATMVAGGDDEDDEPEPAVKQEGPAPLNKVEPAPLNKRGPGRPPKVKAPEQDDPSGDAA